MKIVSCFTRLEELEPLAEAGADEFYTAVETLPAFSFGVLPYRELSPAIKKAHSLGKKVAVALNAVLAPAGLRRLRAIETRVKAIDNLGADAFIISNPYLLEFFSGTCRLRAQLHLSSVQPVFNSRAAAFFSDRFGISRIILPNQLAPAEARGLLDLCRTRGIDTEIFDYRFFGCAYVNGRCLLHKPEHYTLRSTLTEGSLCRISAQARARVSPLKPDQPGRSALLPGLIMRLGSRLTGGGAPRLSDSGAFFDFLSSGVQFLKYGTRHDPTKTKVAKVRHMRAMISRALELRSTLPEAEARKIFVQELGSWNGGGL